MGKNKKPRKPKKKVSAPKQNMHKMLAQAQEAQKNLAETEAMLEKHELSLDHEGVSITVSGAGNLSSLRIAKELVQADDVPAMEAKIRDAINMAREKAAAFAASQQEQAVPSGLKDFFG